MANKYKALSSNWKAMWDKDLENVRNQTPMTNAMRSVRTAYNIVNNDKYYELDNVPNMIDFDDYQKTFTKLDKVRTYSMRIMNIVDLYEGEYAKTISNRFENVSMIDIRSFTSGRISVSTTKRFKNTVDDFNYVSTTDINILTLLENAKVLSLKDTYMNNSEFADKSYEEFLKKHINSKYNHMMLVDEEILKMYGYAGYIPIVGAGITIYEGIKGKTLTGENMTKTEAYEKILLGSWSVVYDLAGVGPASKVASNIADKKALDVLGRVSLDSAAGVAESIVIDKAIEEYNKNFPSKESDSKPKQSINHNIKDTNWAK